MRSFVALRNLGLTAPEMRTLEFTMRVWHLVVWSSQVILGFMSCALPLMPQVPKDCRPPGLGVVSK